MRFRDNQVPEVNSSATVTIKVLKVSDEGTVTYTPRTNPKRGITGQDDLLLGLMLFEDNDFKGSAPSGGDSYQIDPNNLPQNGTVDLDPATGEFTYIPDENFNGEESFTILVNKDGQLERQIVMLTILPVNDPPTRTGVNFQMLSGRKIRELIPADDVDVFTNGDVLSYILVSLPANGTVELIPVTGEFSYESKDGFIGQDTFVVRVQDQFGEFIDCTISVDVREEATVKLLGTEPTFTLPAYTGWILLGLFCFILLAFFVNVRITYMTILPNGKFKKVTHMQTIIAGRGDEVVVNLSEKRGPAADRSMRPRLS